MVRYAILLLALVVVAPAATRARAKRPPKPKLLLKANVLNVAGGDKVVAGHVVRALQKAIDASPLAIRSLGLAKGAGMKQMTRELRRRRLRYYAVGVSVPKASHRVVKQASGKQLVAEVTVNLMVVKVDKKRPTVHQLTVTGKSSTAISVLLQGEILAARIAASRQAVTLALTAILDKLLPKKKRRRRRR